VTLNGVAPGGGVNILLASDSNNARVPAVVTVPFGQRSMDFAITTLAVTSAQIVNLTATLSRTTVPVTLTLLPPLQLTLAASAVVGGNPVSGTVTLGDPAPTAGAIVTLQSADTAAQVQPVTIPAGQSLQTFTVTTSAVTAARTVTISAIYGLLRQTALLTVNPVAAATLPT
jgi:hypothetical protein